MSATLEFEDRDWVLDDHDWSPKAWMSVRDADLFEALLLRKAEERPFLDVLEWGSGRSTGYFTRLLAEKGTPFRWLSLEYDRAYFRTELEPMLGEMPDARVEFVSDDESRRLSLGSEPPTSPVVEFVVFDKHKLLPMMRDHKADRAADLDAYVEFPARQARQFDVILVDGRKRRRCLEQAARLLAPAGVALLHDAWRPYYHCAFTSYAAQTPVGDILWIGTQAGPAYLATLLEGLS